MKIYTLICLFISYFLFSQNAQVGINTKNPDPSAILHIENFSGVPATATAAISGGTVNSITISDGGSGYTSVPTVNFYGGGPAINGGNKAKAIAVVTGGTVTGITIVDGGSGYTSIPTVNISGGNKGLLLPSVNLTDVNSIITPVSVPADGLLVYNGGTNTNKNTLHFFNSAIPRWQSSIDAEDTPKVAYADLTGSLALLDNAVSGDNSPLLVNPLSISGVSNITGFKVVQNGSSYSLVLPQGNYLVEINLNITAPQENPSGQGGTAPLGASTFYLMGYFVDFYDDTYNNSTGIFTTGSLKARKEIPIISKLNTNHLATWSYYYSVPSNADVNIIGGLRLNFGRMQGSTFYDLVNIVSNESYIKISKL